MAGARSVVSTIGLHGSASTWVFNIARELTVVSTGEAAMGSGFAEQVQAARALEKPGVTDLVIKSHRGDEAFDQWLKERQAKIILSIRDPRDAALSMARRFRTPIAFTSNWVLADCRRISALMGREHLLLRYENRFFEDPLSVRAIAETIDINVTAEVADQIFASYTASAVREIADSLIHLPPGHVQHVGRFRMDPKTQILEGHVGDRRSEKWRELDEASERRLTECFFDYLLWFGYPTTARPISVDQGVGVLKQG